MVISTSMRDEFNKANVLMHKKLKMINVVIQIEKSVVKTFTEASTTPCGNSAEFRYSATARELFFWFYE